MPQVKVTINGKEYAHEVEARLLLVHYIREKARLTGTHVGCDTGNCGACTVLLDGKLIKSCLALAVQANGARITTIEGLAPNGLHPLQDAFLDKFALQCGYCTPGMILTAYSLLLKKPVLTEADIIESMEENLCRCGAHQRIVRAIQSAAKQMRG